MFEPNLQTPWILSWPIESYCRCIPDQFYSFTYWMEYMNSFVNPIILIVGNTHFRSRFLLMLKRPCVGFKFAKSSVKVNQQKIGPNLGRVRKLPNETGANLRFNSTKRFSKQSILM